MTISEQKYFLLLKDKIVETMQKSYPGIPDSISEWKGQNIVDFQSELKFKQKEHLSEKWFYTHMKSESRKLPRIDVLNFLAQYVGFRNWEDFMHFYSEKKQNNKGDKSNRSSYLVPLIMVVSITLLYLVYKSFYAQEYTFCFYDSVSKQAITNTVVEVTLMEKSESDRNYLCSSEGCFSLKTNKKSLQFVVESPYYRRDTIVRRLNNFNRTENIKLQVDDYAIMIHYFSNSKVNDWLKRRENLDNMFTDNAKIFQVNGATIGMEIYNKWEFINKLSLPTSGLRDVQILDARYEGEKITHLRFKQNE